MVQKQIAEMNALAFEWFKEIHATAAPTWRNERYVAIEFDDTIRFSWDEGHLSCYEEGCIYRSYEDFQKWLDGRDERIAFERDFEQEHTDILVDVIHAFNGEGPAFLENHPDFTVDVIGDSVFIKLDKEVFRKWRDAR